MTLLRLPPAWSPLTLGALFAGVRAAWLTDGSRARHGLESALCSAYAPKTLFLTNSGTSALIVALQVAWSSTRAAVALPAYCCYDVATATDGAGTPFLLYDLDPDTLSPNLASLRRAFEAGARSVVVAHLYGAPADLAAVQGLAAEFGALVIEDAAQGSGCALRGKPAGSLGALGVLSFGRGKGVTGGKGGALLVNEARFVPAAEAAWLSRDGLRHPRGSLWDFFLLSAQWVFGRPSLYWIPAGLPFLGLGTTSYRRPSPVGDISTFAAGVLVRTLALVPGEVARRRANADRPPLPAGEGTPPGIPVGWEAGWLRLPVVLQRTAAGSLSPQSVQGGAIRGYPQSLADLPGFGERRLNQAEQFPGARVLAARLVTFPTHRFVRSASFSEF